MFAQLLRSSRLLAMDSTQQVFTFANKDAAAGTLKRAIPRGCSQMEYFQVDDLDTKYNLTRLKDATWKAAQYDVLTDFLSHTPPSSSGENAKAMNRKNLHDLTEEEFQDLLHRAARKREEFSKLVGSQAIKRQDPRLIEQVLDVRIACDTHEDLYPCSVDYLRRCVPPTSPSENAVAVKGRVLNRFTRGYSIGIGGIVAFLPFDNLAIHPSFDPNDRSKVHDFYVQHVRFNRDGKPDMVLSLDPISSISFEHAEGAKESNEVDRATQADLLRNLLAETTQYAMKSDGQQDRKRKLMKRRAVNKKPSSDAAFADFSDFVKSLGAASGSKKKPNGKEE